MRSMADHNRKLSQLLRTVFNSSHPVLLLTHSIKGKACEFLQKNMNLILSLYILEFAIRRAFEHEITTQSLTSKELQRHIATILVSTLR